MDSEKITQDLITQFGGVLVNSDGLKHEYRIGDLILYYYQQNGSVRAKTGVRVISIYTTADLNEIYKSIHKKTLTRNTN